MEGFSVPTVIALTLWGLLAASVAGYTFKAVKETAP
jgi:hypothetical protein